LISLTLQKIANFCIGK